MMIEENFQAGKTATIITHDKDRNFPIDTIKVSDILLNSENVAKNLISNTNMFSHQNL